MSYNEKELIKHLKGLNVDTRFISLYEDSIYINNFKFSKFSRNKEEIFYETYPDIKVIRSKLFQKICIKVSRTLKKEVKPRQVIRVPSDNSMESIITLILLEPYKRKYGITLTTDDSYDLMVNTKTIDDFVLEYINLMMAGSKIETITNDKTIYPLRHVYHEWINDWIENTDINYIKNEKENTNELLDFLDKNIPNVKESIMQAVEYLDENSIK